MSRRNSKKAVPVLAFLAAVVVLTAACTAQSGTADTTSLAETSTETENSPETTEQAGESQEDTQQQAGIPISVNNDTVELGTLAVFTPSENIEANSGVAIAGSAEEQLQQERIAGGAVGGVVSENLEPLKGITDYSEGDYVPVYGVTME